MTKRHQPASPNGFTLVELLVALFVFSLLSVAGVYLLRSSADGQAVLSARLEENGEIVRAASLIRSDLAHALDRPSRGPGGAPLAAFVAGADQPGGLFAFTKLSSALDSSNGRPDVERIGYAHVQGALMRSIWSMPDGSAEPQAAEIASGISHVALRYRDEAGGWSSSWASTPQSTLPRAVELLLTAEDGTTTRIVAPVGPQQRRSAIEPPAEEEAGE